MGQPAISDNESDALRCPACDYDLRALASDRCPECGVLIDRAALGISQIPWTHRARIGRVRAFRRTVWLVFIRPKRIAADIARPVSLADAKKFQNVVVALAFAPLLALGIWALNEQQEFPLAYQGIPHVGRFNLHDAPGVPTTPPPWRMLGWILQYGGIALAGLCLWLSLKAATGIASYFFHPRSLSIPRQNRAVAVSYYASAPLAWTPITALLLAAVILVLQSHMNEPEIQRIQLALMIVTGISVAMQIGGWWRCSMSLLMNATRCSGLRAAMMGISLPFLWLACPIVIFGILSAAYLFVCIVILSVM